MCRIACSLRFLFSLLLAQILLAGSAYAEESLWKVLEPGFSLAHFTPDTDGLSAANIVVLRLDPEEVEFVLLSASHKGNAASLSGWADAHNLAAAINASMYLPDGVTSTGYMRNGESLNNARIMTNFGAFFVAGRRDGGKPSATLLDRTQDDWETALPLYDIVVQNYRLISADGRMLWMPGGPSYAAAAIGQDTHGNILFIHSREPMSGENFGNLLLTLPLDLRMVMYVEGGTQASMLVRAGDVDKVWMGRHMADFLTSGNKNAPLPNVLGVRRKPSP